MQSRKQFLKNTAALAAGSLWMGFKPDRVALPSSLRSSSYITFDLHCHPGRLFALGSNDFGPPMVPDMTLNEMNQIHLSGAFFSLVADTKLIELGPSGIHVKGKYNPGDAWAEYKRQLRDMKDFFQTYHVHHATKATDLSPKKSLAAFISVEGGDFLEGQVDKLDEAYLDGIRSVQIVHYAPNDLGDLQTSTIVHQGLSSFGKEVVRRMNKLGLLIDVAHATYQTAKNVADLTEAPVMLSHSILQMEPNRPMGARAISTDHAKVIADTGGVIGAWPSGFNKSFDEYVDNIFRLIEVAGIDHVSLGTDMDGNFKPVLSSYTQFPSLSESLQHKGLTAKEMKKVMGGNVARVLKKVLKSD
jgi:membrane dipeptidase